MDRIRVPAERKASPEELAEDRRRYLAAQAETSPISKPEPVPEKREPYRSFQEEWAVLWMRTGSEEVLRIGQCAQEELRGLAIKLVESGVASYATASRTTVETTVVQVDDLTERTTTTTTVTMADFYVGEMEGQPPLVGRRVQS